MIQRVYEQVSKTVKTVYVATDDRRILDEVNRFRGHAVLTSPLHNSGTDRCAEAIQIIEREQKTKFDIIVNIQGDEPFIQPAQIETLCGCFSDGHTQIATLIRTCKPGEDIFDPNRVKVITDNENNALCFSRSVIPYLRNSPRKEEWSSRHNYFVHIGMYAYKKDVLFSLSMLKPTRLETAESLEQLRWIENGYKIKTAHTDYESFSIDTPEDLKILEDKGLLR